MAADPEEIVSIDLVGNLDQFDRTVKQSADDFGGNMDKIKVAATKAEGALDNLAAAQAKHETAAKGWRQQLKEGTITLEQFNAEVLRSKQNLSQAETSYKSAQASLDRMTKGVAVGADTSRRLGLQIGQIGSQVAVGTSPFIIIAQQASDVSMALDGAGGAVGRVARFFATWQGALVLAAATIASQIIPKLFNFSDALKDEIDELQKAADKAAISEKAHKAFGATVDGVTDSLRKNREELEKLNKAQDTSAETALKNAKAQRAIIAKQASDLSKDQQDAEAAVKQATNPNLSRGAPGAQLIAINSAIAKLTEVQRKITATKANLAEADRQIKEAESFVVVEQQTADAVEKINRKYDEQVDVLRKQAVAHNTVKTQLADQIAAVEKLRKAEIERYQAAEAARKKAAADEASGTITNFINPVGGGRITGTFGESRGGARKHLGTDIATAVGTPVKAAAGGTVIEAGTLPGYGNVIFIDHGAGTITRSAHLSKLLAKKGDIVSQGQVVGLSGGAKGAPGSGDSTGPHLHFEVRRNGKPVDASAGRFPTDTLGAQAKGITDLQKEAEKELARRQAFENELAGLSEDEVNARKALLTSAQEIAKLELAAIEISRKKYDDNLDSLVEQGKLTKDEAEQLRAINDERAGLRAELVKRREQERLFRLQEANLQHQASFDSNNRQIAEDLLNGQLDLAKTQKERRELESRLLDLQYAEERARNDYLIAYYERLKTQKGISESELSEAEAQAKIAEAKNASIDQRQSNAQTKSDRSTAGPIESFFNSIPTTADEINEALEGIAAGGLATFTDALTDAIVNFKSLGDVGLAVLHEITASLVKLAIQQILMRTIGNLAGTAAVAATAAQAAAAATAWAPAAALASLATLGTNAAPAAAAIASTTALSFGVAGLSAAGLAGGGPVIGSGGPTDDSVPLWGSNGEYMIRASSVRKLGRDNLDYLNRTGQMPGRAYGGPITGSAIVPSNARAAGANSAIGLAQLSEDSVMRLGRIVSEASRSMPPVNLYPTLDPGKALQAALSSPGGSRAFFDFMTDNSGRFKAALS